MGVLVIALIIDIMKPASLGFTIPGMVSEYGVPKATASLVPFFALTGTVVGSIVWGMIADIYGRKASILLSAVMFVGTSICGAMPSLYWNVGMCFMMGAAAGGMLPVTYALLAEMMPSKHRGEQRISDRKHPAGRRTHHEAHADVPVERGHRAADRRAYEHHRRQQDRRLAPVNIGDDAPHDRADHGPGQREERHQRGGRLGHAIFADHPGDGEAQARRLHDVDDERDHQHAHQHPVGAGQRRVLGRRNDDVLRCGKLAGDVLGQKP